MSRNSSDGGESAYRVLLVGHGAGQKTQRLTYSMNGTYALVMLDLSST